MSIISYNDIYTVYAWQENNRTFTVTTNEGGIKHIRLILKDKQTALNVSGEEVSIYYAATKPNNKEVLVSASKIDAENGVIEFPIEPALTTNPGMVNGEIRVITPLGVLKFYGINLKVHKGVSDKAAEQAEAYTALVEALRKVSALLASSTIAPLDDINEFDTGDKGRLNPVASGTLYEILQRYVKNDFTIAGLDLSKPITTANLREALLMNKFHFSVGKPTTSTKGRQGDFCYDTSREKLYLCIQAINGVYTWKDVSEFIDISDVLQSYVLNTIKIAGLSLNKDIESEELAEALNHYPFIVFTDTPTTSTKGKVGQFGGLINYNASSQSYTVKLFLCCSAGKTEGTYQWMLINSNTISDEQIKSALDEYLTKNPISGTGADGEDGVGIEATEINNDGELVVTYTDGKVENVGIVVGVDGKDGENGVNGITPHIGDNGNWYVGDTDTGKPSQGQDGENGKDGNDGQDGYSPTISVSPTETGYMLTIDHNENFQENVFIENGADGEKGEKGDTGAQGEKGADGYTPVKGVDYFTEEDKKVMVEDVRKSLDGIPDYWQEHLDGKIALIREAMLSVGLNKSAFFFYSDSHWSNATTYTAKMAPALLKYLCKNTPINKTNFGGDIVSAESTDAETMAYLWEWRNLLYGLPNHHSVVGNHDDGNHTNNLFSEEYVYAYLLAPEETYDIVRDDGAMYYYIDNSAEKTRYLYLDTSYKGVTTEEQSFVKSALLSTPENWHIVVIAHMWYHNDYTTYPPVLNGFDTNAKKLLDMFDNYNARNGDFATCVGKVELCIGGHYHLDHVEYTDGGIPVVIVEADALHDRSGTMPKAGTTDEAAISAVIVDYTAQQVKVIRIGRGSDFTANVANGDVVKYYTVTSNLTNASLSSNVTSVEADGAYNTTLTATAGTLTSVVITMGGENVTSSVYDESTGEISIAKVTGNVVIVAVAEVVQETTYTNVIPISIDSTGAIFNSGQGWADNSRIGSGKLENYVGNSTMYITGHIEIDPTIDNTIRLRNVTFDRATTETKIGIAFYDETFTRAYPLSTNSSNNFTTPSAIANASNGYDAVLDGTNIVQFTLKNGSHIDNTEVKYIAICAEYIGNDSIITINEPIE